jgi:hypothetical protein
MPILGITTSVTGLVGVAPRIVYIQTNDTQATVATAGYLNHSVTEGFVFQPSDLAIVQTTQTGLAKDSVSNWYQVVFAAPNWSLVPDVNPGSVLLPVTVGHIATFSNVAGQVGDLATPAVHLADIQAGANGIAGSFTSFSATPNRGFLNLHATANGGAFNAVITNAALGQTTTFTVPDPGIAATNFLLTNSGGTQTIATGSLALTLGSFQTLAGNITAGSSGHAGTLTSFPGTAANGSLIIAAVNNVGNFTTTVSSVTALGQSTVVTIPDPGAATANFLLDAGTSNLVTDYQQMVPVQNMMLAAAGGVFTQTRNAQGDWAQVHTPAADTSVVAWEITEQLRAAAGRGFELTSFDVIYSIATLALVSNAATLNTVVYANNVAVAVTANATTGALATATQAQPYVTNLTVNVPAFNNPTAGQSIKQVIEITVNAAATSVYSIYGVNLRFTKSIK